jgi:RNA polymerase sigma-70 factor (ECF subfamily)
MSATAADPASEDFAQLTEPLRPELLAYCYRMLGSVHDAEDQVQETLIRAWRSYGGFEGRASLRTWLYRIATNSCLRAIENRSRRPLPSGLGGPADDPEAPLAPARFDLAWLQPIPDALVPGEAGVAGRARLLGAGSPGGAGDPAVIVAARGSTRLALIATLQYLPGRQRAVLILRDVLGWRAAEVADLLDTTTVAVNSALQRARAQLRHVAPAQDDISEPAEADQRALLDRYAAAFETADIAALMDLLTRDAVLEMPPLPTWFAGRENVGRFLAFRVLPRPGEFRMIPVSANGQPALAAYTRGPDGGYHAHAIQVLTCTGSGIARVMSFNDATLFPFFGLPDDLAGLAPAATALAVAATPAAGPAPRR